MANDRSYDCVTTRTHTTKRLNTMSFALYRRIATIRSTKRSFSTNGNASTKNLTLEKKDGVGIFIFNQPDSKVSFLFLSVVSLFACFFSQ
jgi:hypothetical protein